MKRAVRAAILAVVVGLTPTVAGAAAVEPVRPRAGSVVGTTSARGLAVVAGARSAQILRYRMTSARGEIVEATGLVLLPRGQAPRAGWPFVVYNHVTTGSADICDPSQVRADGDSAEYMLRGDDIATRLLRAGVAVLRPDYEGIGVPGPHPYLVGKPLATSVVDMVTAARRLEPRLGRNWVVAGHSEGAIASLFTASATQKLPAGTHLRGVVAYTPETQMDKELEVLRAVPARVPEATDELTPLAGLIIGGAAAAYPDFERLIHRGGLSNAALALLPDLEKRCLVGLGEPDSWGGIAPADIPGSGARGNRAVDRLVEIMQANDPINLSIRAGVPVRIDAGALDLVAPLPFTAALAAAYQADGVDVELHVWPGGHPEVVKNGYAAGPSVAWILQRLGLN